MSFCASATHLLHNNWQGAGKCACFRHPITGIVVDPVDVVLPSLTPDSGQCIHHIIFVHHASAEGSFATDAAAERGRQRWAQEQDMLIGKIGHVIPNRGRR